MAKTKIVLSFDDGRGDNYRAFTEVIIPLQLKATLNVTAGYIDGTIPNQYAPCPNKAMSLEELSELAAFEQIEIAGHGDYHQNALKDLSDGIQKLRQWLPNKQIIGIASPNSKLTEQQVLMNREDYETIDVSYVRIGPGASYRSFRRVCGKLARMLHSARLYCYSVAGAHYTKEQNFVLLSVPVMKQHTLRQVKKLIQNAAKQDHHLILMFHSILKPGEPYYEDTWNWDYDDFLALCRWLQENESIEVVTTTELVQAR